MLSTTTIIFTIIATIGSFILTCIYNFCDCYSDYKHDWEREKRSKLKSDFNSFLNDEITDPGWVTDHVNQLADYLYLQFKKFIENNPDKVVWSNEDDTTFVIYERLQKHAQEILLQDYLRIYDDIISTSDFLDVFPNKNKGE